MKLEIEKEYRAALGEYRYFVWQDGSQVGGAH